MGTDIFSLGGILYEMLTGERPFQGPSTSAIMIAITREQPKPLRDFKPGIPNDLQQIMMRCLQKAREDRYPSASDLVLALEECRRLAAEPSSGINFRVLLRQSKRPRVVIPIVLMPGLLGSLLGWWIHRAMKARSARAEALPAIAQLVEEEKLGDAYALAVQAEKYIPDDASLNKLWSKMSYFASIRTTPAAAAVFRRNSDSQNRAWEFVGRTPIGKYRSPLVNFQWKIELPGFATMERSTIALLGGVWPSESISVGMDENAKAPKEMIHQIDGASFGRWGHSISYPQHL